MLQNTDRFEDQVQIGAIKSANTGCPNMKLRTLLLSACIFAFGPTLGANLAYAGSSCHHGWRAQGQKIAALQNQNTIKAIAGELAARIADLKLQSPSTRVPGVNDPETAINPVVTTDDLTASIE